MEFSAVGARELASSGVLADPGEDAFFVESVATTESLVNAGGGEADGASVELGADEFELFAPGDGGGVIANLQVDVFELGSSVSDESLDSVELFVSEGLNRVNLGLASWAIGDLLNLCGGLLEKVFHESEVIRSLGFDFVDLGL